MPGAGVSRGTRSFQKRRFSRGRARRGGRQGSQSPVVAAANRGRDARDAGAVLCGARRRRTNVRQNKIETPQAEGNMANIAFIGLGNMGGPMAANLVKGGHKVVAFDLVAASRDQAKADGAAIAESTVAAVKGAEIVVTMLPAGRHVLSVWNEVVPVMDKAALIIDC